MSFFVRRIALLNKEYDLGFFAIVLSKELAQLKFMYHAAVHNSKHRTAFRLKGIYKFLGDSVNRNSKL